MNPFDKILKGPIPLLLVTDISLDDFTKIKMWQADTEFKDKVYVIDTFLKGQIVMRINSLEKSVSLLGRVSSKKIVLVSVNDSIYMQRAKRSDEYKKISFKEFEQIYSNLNVSFPNF